MKRDAIHAHWRDWATRYRDSVRATTRTPTAKRLEIDAFERALRDRDATRGRVLEVGCGNGVNCFALAERFPELQFCGVDFVGEMIESAEATRRTSPLGARTRFVVGDVLALDDADLAPTFDIVLSNRCLINLPSAGLQARALNAIAQRVAPGGLLLLIENSLQSHAKQNDCREALGLDRREVAEFNRFFDDEELEGRLGALFAEVAVRDFSSLHDVVLYALLPATNGGKIEYDHPLVAAAAELSAALPDALYGTLGALGQNRLWSARHPKKLEG